MAKRKKPHPAVAKLRRSREMSAKALYQLTRQGREANCDTNDQCAYARAVRWLIADLLGDPTVSPSSLY